MASLQQLHKLTSSLLHCTSTVTDEKAKDRCYRAVNKVTLSMKALATTYTRNGSEPLYQSNISTLSIQSEL